jgi:hypothetical protein
MVKFLIMGVSAIVGVVAAHFYIKSVLKQRLNVYNSLITLFLHDWTSFMLFKLDTMTEVNFVEAYGGFEIEELVKEFEEVRAQDIAKKPYLILNEHPIVGEIDYAKRMGWLAKYSMPAMICITNPDIPSTEILAAMNSAQAEGGIR